MNAKKTTCRKLGLFYRLFTDGVMHIKVFLFYFFGILIYLSILLSIYHCISPSNYLSICHPSVENVIIMNTKQKTTC